MDAIKVLTDVEKIKSIQLGDELPEDVETAFENILSYIDDLDVANGKLNSKNLLVLNIL